MCTGRALSVMLVLASADAGAPARAHALGRSARCGVRATVAHTLHTRALSRIHNGHCDHAAVIYDRALVKDPNPTSFLLKALLMERMGQWEAARLVFREGNRRYPMDGRLLQAWGLLESRLGDDALALRLLRRCVAVDGRLAPVLRWKRFSAVA